MEHLEHLELSSEVRKMTIRIKIHKISKKYNFRLEILGETLPNLITVDSLKKVFRTLIFEF